MAEHKIFNMAFADIYDAYVNKAERKDRTKDEVDEILRWYTGASEEELSSAVEDRRTMREFFEQAPALNPNRELITGSVCGVEVQEVSDPLMREIRFLDKLIDELAKGKAMEKIKRS